jgi:hypothetical protein
MNQHPGYAVLAGSAALVLLSIVATAGPAVATSTPGPINIVTFHNDNTRSGLNPHETNLLPANVNVSSFGKLFSYPVDGYLYAEPLYVSQLPIPGQATHNVVYVASEHDTVYAFDADGLVTTPLWQKSFIDPANGITTVSALNDIGCANLVPEIGITGTPVISLANQALYVVSETKNQNTGTFALELHALDLATGAEKFGGPVPISATVAGVGNGNDGHGHVSFVAKLALQRPALLFLNGTVYIAFGSNCDIGDYHGWVLAYDGLTLAQEAVFNTTPNGSEGGIWQSGNGPSASPAGKVFVGIGNGSFNGTTDFGDSFVKLDPGSLRVLDYFTPSDQALLSELDDDSGITGAVLLPTQSFGPAAVELLGGIKSGRLYLLNRSSMGKFCASCDDSQAIGIVDTGFGIFDAPAFAFGMVYLGGVATHLKAWQILNGSISAKPVARTMTIFGYPGTTPAISSNGNLHPIIWALDTSGFGTGKPAVLHAYRYNLVGLYNSAAAPGARDTAGPAVKFTVPTVANGKVYVGTQTELDVYGLLP